MIKGDDFMTWLIKLILFICIVPSTIILFAIGFPKDPAKKKLIFGVSNNPKFHEGDAAKKLKDICSSCRRSALIITAAVCLAALILLVIPSTDLTVTFMLLLVFVMFLIAVPFGKGNTELKNLKKELGITKSGIVYTDISNANVIHALKLPWLLLPNILALIGTVAALLIDLGMLNIKPACERYALTSLSLSFLSLAVLLVPIGIMMDNTRNMVISKDSNINANYNRAKKKTWADLIIGMSWANALFLIGFTILNIFVSNEIVMIAGIALYTLVIMIAAMIGVATQAEVEKRYERDTELELTDDDDRWVLGMFYYNPNDCRLNVEKRYGYGGTINMAHPAGKVIAVLSLLLILGSIIYFIYAGVTGQFASGSLSIH